MELRLTGMTYKDIGDQLGITRQAVENSIKNAKQRSAKFEAKKFETPTRKYKAVEKNGLWNLRKSMEITQEEISKILNISTASYSTKEQNVDKFKVSEIKKVCSFLECSIDEIIS